jgi:Leucine-rich repeat (LRR) protein
LDISDFTNLEELRCGVNQLNRIIFPINNKLKVLDCSNNHLISLDYASLNPAILKELNLFNNKLISADISVFSQLLNLTILQIGNNNE